jgi:rRNA maturation endonuclease Nob1
MKKDKIIKKGTKIEFTPDIILVNPNSKIVGTIDTILSLNKKDMKLYCIKCKQFTKHQKNHCKRCGQKAE